MTNGLIRKLVAVITCATLIALLIKKYVHFDRFDHEAAQSIWEDDGGSIAN